MKKFRLNCTKCGTAFDFKKWFEFKQLCFSCGSNKSEVIYDNLEVALRRLVSQLDAGLPGMWHYFDVLPLSSKKNIISSGEGGVSIDRWSFLEKAAGKFGIKCKVYAHRQDNNNATGTFKDLAGSMVASSFKENAIKRCAVASTGNIGVAYSRYISACNGEIYIFVPRDSSKMNEAEGSIFGQKVFRVNGDYSKTKLISIEFAEQFDILHTGDTFDPLRIEAKKTMAFEWKRQMPEFPTVYIQAISGGTGPLGINKGCGELLAAGEIGSLPRFILVQSSGCSPMADAWAQAVDSDFSEGWEERYPVYKNPVTSIMTLATGDPRAYPVIAKVVRESRGGFITFPEKLSIDVAKIVAYEAAVRIGPAAAIAVGGFFNALNKKLIVNGDTVLINIGEGIRRSPDFMIKSIQPSCLVNDSNDYGLFDRDDYGKELWSDFLSDIKG